MGYTQFYKEAAQEKPNMKLSELFSDSFKRHSRSDVEYALAAGGIYDRADGNSMLVKWNKPWLWLRVFMLLLALTAGNYLIIKMTVSMGKSLPIFGWTIIMFSTLVTPVTLLILIWELNVPRNISIFSLGLYFIIGGMMSLVFTVFFNLANLGKGSWVAPLAEEPAKLAATLLLIYFFSKKGKKVYGMTGLIIGAAVGTGFTVFETYQYAYDTLLKAAVLSFGGISEAALYGLETVFKRSIPGINGHLLYCAPYTAAFALAYYKNRSWKGAFTDMTFWAVFASSCAMHALWNSSFNTGWVTKIFIRLCSFVILYYMVCKCFSQVISEGRYYSGDKAKEHGRNPAVAPNSYGASGVRLTGVCVMADGRTWSAVCPVKGQAVVGRDPSCALRFPADIRGVSRRHCVITRCNGQVYVQDLNSSCGTFVNRKRLSGQERVIVTGTDKIYIGSSLAYIRIE